MHSRITWGSRLGILVLILNLCAPLIAWDAATAAQSDATTETPDQIVSPEATTPPTATATTPPGPGKQAATESVVEPPPDIPGTDVVATDVVTEEPPATGTETPVPPDQPKGSEQPPAQGKMQVSALEALAIDVQLANPVVAPVACVKGVVSDWQVTMPADTEAIDYSWDNPGISDGTTAITFTLPGTSTLLVSGSMILKTGYTLPGSLPTGWTATEVPIPGILDAIYVASHGPVTCTTTADPTITVDQGFCTGPGAASDSQVTATANGGGYSISVDPSSPQSSSAARDWTVNLILIDGYGWPPMVTAANGWSFDGARAWKTYPTVAVNCHDAAVLFVPGVVSAACVTGSSLDYQVILPTDTEVIDYTWTNPASNGSSQVTGTVPATGGHIKGMATIQSGYTFASSPPNWTGSGATREYSRTLGSMACADTQSPVISTSQATCTNGVLGMTQVTANAVGAGYRVSVSPAISQPADIARSWSVSLTLDDGYTWPPDLNAGNGWTISGNQASKVVRTEATVCATVSPAIPTVVNAACANGALTDYQVTLPVDTDGLDYTWVSPLSDGTTEVTATIASRGGGILGLVQIRDGHVFGPSPIGWSFSTVGRTYARSLLPVSCETTTNPVITVNQGSCINAVVQPAQVTALATGTGSMIAVNPASAQPGSAPHDWTVTLTIESGYSWPPGVTTANGWGFSGNQALRVYRTEAVDCNSPITPHSPTLLGGLCVSGVPSAYLVTLPADSDGVDYAWTSPASDGASDVISTIPPIGGMVQGTATIRNGHAFGPNPDGWTGTGNTRTFSLILPAVTCRQVPAVPTVVNAACVNGVVTDYQVTFPADTSVFDYRWGPPLNEATTELTVSYPAPAADAFVSLAGQVRISSGYSFGPLPAGWIRSTDLPSEFRLFGITLRPVTCEATTPVTPSVVDASCRNGILTDYQATLPGDTDGIDYTWTRPASDGVSGVTGAVSAGGGSIKGTATIKNGYTFGVNPPGWTGNGATRTYSQVLVKVPCTPTIDPTISVNQGACVGTVVQPSQVTASANGTGYSVSVTPNSPQPSTVARDWTVTLTVQPGHLWPPSVTAENGWTFSGYQASRVIVTAEANCVEVLPAKPEVVQAACTDGAITDPTVTLPDDTRAIDYSLAGTIARGNTVTVTATLADGYAWGDVTNAVAFGWVFTATGGTLEVELRDVACTPTVPLQPSVTEGRCLGGQLLNPTLLLPAVGDALAYSRTPGNEVPGGEVTVTPTLRDGFAWGDTTDAEKNGWVFTTSSATLVVTFKEVECERVLPVNPRVVQEQCANGATTVPSVTPPPDTTAIMYAMRGSVSPGDSVMLIATLQPEFAWGDTTAAEAAGWTFTTTAASLEVVLVDIACIEATPAIPKVHEAACVGGKVAAPTVTTGPTTGVSYRYDPSGPYVAGQTVKVTAVLAAGYGWSPILPDDWTWIDPVTATYEVDFAEATCPPATDVPTATVIPTATQVPTETPVPTAVPSETPVPTAVPSETPVPTAVSSETPAPTIPLTETPVPTEQPRETPTATGQPGQIVIPTGAPPETPSPVSGLPDTGQRAQHGDHLPVALLMAASVLLIIAWQLRTRTDRRSG